MALYTDYCKVSNSRKVSLSQARGDSYFNRLENTDYWCISDAISCHNLKIVKVDYDLRDDLSIYITGSFGQLTNPSGYSLNYALDKLEEKVLSRYRKEDKTIEIEIIFEFDYLTPNEL